MNGDMLAPEGAPEAQKTRITDYYYYIMLVQASNQNKGSRIAAPNEKRGKMRTEMRRVNQERK